MSQQVRIEQEMTEDPSEEIVKQSEVIKGEIGKLNSEKARGVMLRSKAEWVEFGENRAVSS